MTLIVNHFCMKVPSKIFEWVLNTPLNFGVMDLFYSTFEYTQNVLTTMREDLEEKTI